ncbi:MAG: RsmB/NOP family class I SAM-dependent RNA methyltransferase [Candidatus Bathyarchaeia archaeon]
MTIEPNALATAIEALSWIELSGIGLSYATMRAAKQLGIRDEAVIASANALVQETLRREAVIGRILATVVPSELLHKVTAGVRSFLRIYTYLTKLSPQTCKCCVELVEASREILGWKTLHPVEAFLGRLLTFEPATIYEGLADVERTALETSHPDWFVKYCYRLLGRREALRLLRKSAEGVSSYVHLNTLHGSEETITAALTRERINLSHMPEMLHLHLVSGGSRLLWRTEAYRKGLLYLEDKGSYLAVSASGVEKGMRVLGMFADGAAKIAHLAQLMENSGVILYAEPRPEKTKALERDIKRLGVKIAKPLSLKTQTASPAPIDADIIVVNPPSSLTGIFGTEPSIRWSVKPEDIKKNMAQQVGALEEFSRHVKVGGVVIYITSSITVEENEMVLEHFLSLKPDFRLVEVRGVGRPAFRELHNCVRIYPHLHDSDGSFIAKIRREG